MRISNLLIDGSWLYCIIRRDECRNQCGGKDRGGASRSCGVAPRHVGEIAKGTDGCENAEIVGVYWLLLISIPFNHT